MDALLDTVARAYSERYKDLKQICFLFPNKRCGIFLKKYFAKYGKLSSEMPHILTISEFMSQVARKNEASKIVQLFTLFNCYKELEGNNFNSDFESFRGWGEIILSDFNIIDQNLSDPEEIFKNVKDFRELSSNFLTDDQKEVLKEYFGIQNFNESNTFWKIFENPDKITPLQQKFLNIWQVLSPLHEKFVDKLNKKGLGSVGTIYRMAADKIAEKGQNILPYKKIVAVGFNALSEAERSIFKDLQKLEGYPGFDAFIDFIWDLDGPLLLNSQLSASRFVKYNKKCFPTAEWLLSYFKSHNKNNLYPHIEIISSPSLTAQAKVAGEILSGYKSPELKEMMANAEVALILPDESLLSNILYSLPEDLEDINLTMGYSLRLAPVSAFMALLRRLFKSMKENNRGKDFFVRDLKKFFSHPYSFILFQETGIDSLLEFVDNYHKIRISLEEISEFLPDAKEYLNFSSNTQNPDEALGLLEGILESLLGKISELEGEKDTQDIAEIKIYKEYIEGIKEALKQYKIEINVLSVLQIIDKLISNEKIGFEGEPLAGLQVMGTLETRSLDFKHVIILSMNEGIMPRKVFMSTFIPESLRKAYGLPPARYAEELFGYYFYRMISRAEKVTLIYDGRTLAGMRGGESRYLLQLKHFVPSEFIKEEIWQFRFQQREETDSSVIKTPEINAQLELFCKEGDNSKNFSASTLNTYRECQVRFFLQNVLNINSDPEKSEYMDAIEIGDVLHNVMMQLYLPEDKQKKILKDPILIDRNFLVNILNNHSLIRDLVIKNINIIYYRNKDLKSNYIESGVTEIIAEQIIGLIVEIVKHDLTLAPFKLYGCEISKKLRIKLSSGRMINFRFAIDRLDEINIDGRERLRIVDYKTGGKKRRAKDIPTIFKGGYESEQIFQLFIYAWLLGKTGTEGWEDVITEIYFVPDLIKGEEGKPELGGEKVESFRPYIKEFNEHLEAMIESIFNNEKFNQCESSIICGYCPFRSYCGK